MKRGFLSSIVGIGLLVVLIFTTGINCWQNDRVERRFIDLSEEVDQLEKKLATGGFTSSAGGTADRPTGGIFGAPTPDYIKKALQDPDNALSEDPEPLLPPDAVLSDTLTHHFGSDPKGFNWVIENGSDVTEIQRFVHMETMQRHRSDDTRWAPALAYHLKIDERPDGGMTYTMKLREDIFWHEPRVDWASGEYEWLRGKHQVTAHDIVFTLAMIMNPQVTKAAPLRSYLKDLESFTAPDDFTFVMEFKTKVYDQMSIIVPSMYPTARFLYEYDEDGSKFDAEILGQKFQDHWYNPMGLGCGPYELAEVEQGVKIVLERNPNFPLGGNAFEKVVYRILSDQNQPPRMLRTGELDQAYVQPGQYRTEWIEGAPDSPFKNGDLFRGEYWTHSYFYIGWNQRLPLFADKKVRKALSHAFNADLLLQDVFMGLGERVTGPIPSFLPWYNRELPLIPFDLDKARALLDEAGWTDSDGDGIRDKMIDGRKTPFEFALMSYGSSDEYRTVGNIYKEDLAKIGIKMTPTPMEWSNLLKKVNDREFDAVTLAWVSSPDVTFRQIWHSEEADKPKSSNHVGFKSAEGDRLIEQLEVTFEKRKRMELAHAFHALVYEEQPYTFFFTRKRPAFWTKKLKMTGFSRTRPYPNHLYWHMSPE